MIDHVIREGCQATPAKFIKSPPEIKLTPDVQTRRDIGQDAAYGHMSDAEKFSEKRGVPGSEKNWPNPRSVALNVSRK